MYASIGGLANIHAALSLLINVHNLLSQFLLPTGEIIPGRMMYPLHSVFEVKDVAAGIASTSGGSSVAFR